MNKQIYRHNRSREAKEESERPKNFRGSYPCNASVGQAEDQNLTFFKRGKNFCRREESSGKEGYGEICRAFCLSNEDRAIRCRDLVKETKLPPCLVPISSPVVLKIPKDMSNVEELVRVTVTQPSATFEESECVKMQDAMIEDPMEEFIPGEMRGETSNLSLEVLGELVSEGKPGTHVLVDQQTFSLSAEFTEKEQQECTLEQPDVLNEATVEELSSDVEMINHLNVEVFGTVTKSKTPESDPDHDSLTTPSTATDMKSEKVVDYDFADVDNQKVMERTITMGTMSQFQFTSETLSSAAFAEDCPDPVDPTEYPVDALKTSQLQGDRGFLIEDPEKEHQVWRVWSDILEGLGLS